MGERLGGLVLLGETFPEIRHTVEYPSLVTEAGRACRLLKSNRSKYPSVVSTRMGPENPPEWESRSSHRMARPGRLTSGYCTVNR